MLASDKNVAENFELFRMYTIRVYKLLLIKKCVNFITIDFSRLHNIQFFLEHLHYCQCDCFELIFVYHTNHVFRKSGLTSVLLLRKKKKKFTITDLKPIIYHIYVLKNYKYIQILHMHIYFNG